MYLFTCKEDQMTPVAIGYKTIDNFHEKWNHMKKVSIHILSIMVYSLN